AAVALGIVSFAPPAPAVADDLPDTQFLRWMMHGLGLRRDEAPIEYRERSPLVVPPEMTLPAPETTPLTQRYPEWPIDPEVRQARQQAEVERRRAPQNEAERHR